MGILAPSSKSRRLEEEGVMIPWCPVKELLRRFGSSSGRGFFFFFFGIWMDLCDGFGSVPWRIQWGVRLLGLGRAAFDSVRRSV